MPSIKDVFGPSAFGSEAQPSSARKPPSIREVFANYQEPGPTDEVYEQGLSELSQLTQGALKPETYFGGVKRRAGEAGRTAVDVADIAVGGIPAMVLGTGQEVLGRLSALTDGRGYRQGAKDASAAARATGEAIGRPFYDSFVASGLIDPTKKTIAIEAMEKVSGWLEEQAAQAEDFTGGAISKEDYLASVNGFFAAMGVKGVKATAQAGLNRAGVKSSGKAWEAARARDQAAVEAGKQTVNEFEALSQPTRMQAMPPDELRAQALAEAKARKQKREDVRAAFAEDPDYATMQQRLAEGSAERLEAARAEQARLQPTEMAARTRPPERVITDEVPRELQQNQFGDLTPVSPASLDSAMAKVQRGRLFDLTSEERIALRGSKQITDPKIILPAVIGATGLGLALAFPEEKGEAALASLGAALMLGRGRELKLETIRELPDATPLGAILDRSPVTLSTLEKLPRNRFEFPVQMIEDLLKRQEVTKAERDVLTQALETRPAGSKTITAKELMQGFKVAAGDFELGVRHVDDYANYGLENIDRLHADEGHFAATGENLPMAQPLTGPEARTTIYQVPEHITLGDNNHFQDPRYFGHTRSFEEGGVRHVVELQSDLAQKAGKVLSGEERAALEATRDRMQARIEAALDPSNPERLTQQTRKAVRSYRVVQAEVNAKLQNAGSAQAVEPMLKNWHKRLIREELADAARGDGKVVRFADADTVAKVEGWPTQNDAITLDARRSVEAAERNLSEMEARLHTRSGFSPAEQAQARELIPVIREDIRRAREAYAAARDSQTPRFRPEHQGIYDRYSGDVTKFLKQLGGKHVVDSAGHGWWEVPVEGSKTTPAGPRAQQFGGIDSKLAENVALIGGGAALVAYLSPQEKRARNASAAAAITGLALFARSRSPQVADWAKSAGRGAEYTLGLVSTEVSNLSRPLLHRMREFERKSLTSTHESLAAVAPFIENLRSLPKEFRAKLNEAILSNDSARVIRTLGEAGRTDLLDQWKKARGLLDRIGGDLKATGRLKGLLPDYYPRVVVDAKGLLEALGKEERSFLQTRLDSARAKAQRVDGRDLSPLETSQIINAYLKSRAGGTGKPGFLKKRSVDEVTAELAPFYAPASESLPLYIRAATKEIERARFFGDDLVRDPEGGLANIDLSIGNVVNRERLAGKLDDAGAERLRSILTSRFGPGERATAGSLQTMKNLTNAGLLGHVTSAFVQSGDLLLSVAAHGMLPTIKALQQTVTRNPARVTVRDLGLVDHINEEISGGSRKPLVVGGREISSAKFVEKAFKYSGFSLVDQLGKNVSINAALEKNVRMVQTAQGIAKLRAKYGEAFGPEFDQLVADLRSRKASESVKALLFSELSDIQPITKLEVPQAYLDHPNGRVAYMLKTFMLKQADLVRREAIGEMRKGNVRAGTEKLLRYGLALGIGGASTEFIRAWLLGRAASMDWKDIPENMLKTFGWSQYVVDKARKGEPVAAFGGTALPPWKMWEEIITADPKAIQYIPIAGRLLYAHSFGGAEKANAAAERRRKKEESQ